MSARARLDLVYKNRDSLIQENRYVPWCCGGKYSKEYEVEMETLSTGKLLGQIQT